MTKRAPVVAEIATRPDLAAIVARVERLPAKNRQAVIDLLMSILARLR